MTRMCETCLKYNRKKTGDSEFVPSSRAQENVVLHLMVLRPEDKYMLVAIDYYTRAVRAEVMADKRTETVVRVLDK